MQTNITNHTVTRTVAIAATPDAVLAVVGDARRLPEWAPGFARAVRADGDAWIVDNGDAEFPVRLRVDAELGTVDILGPGRPPRGAFARVIPSGGGAEFIFTLCLPRDTDPAVVAVQTKTVEEELRMVQTLSEARPSAGSAPPPTPN